LPLLDRSTDSLYLLSIYLYFYTTLIFRAYLSSIACYNRDQFLRIRPELLTALEITDDPNAQLKRHKEIYIKQLEGIVQTRAHVFSIDISSALTHYFHVDAKQPDSDTHWQPSTHKDKISLVLEKDTKPPRGVLYFFSYIAGKWFNFNRFAVVLSIGHRHPRIDIMLPPKHTGQLDV
jgi:hypothetical protein